MKLCSLNEVSTAHAWVEVKMRFPIDLSVIAKWAKEHVSEYRYTSSLGSTIWYFEHEQDAIIFKLRFG